MANLTISLTTPSRRTIIILSFLAGTGLLLGGLIIWLLIRPVESRTLMSAALTRSITGFNPYFFAKRVPADYTFDEQNASYDNNVLIIRLTKNGSPDITLTEQAMPSRLLPTDVLSKGDKISTPAGPATVNSVEGRLLGTLVTNKNNVLILVNAPEGAKKSDITAMLQNLRASR